MKRHYFIIVSTFVFIKLYQFILITIIPNQFDLSNSHYQTKSFPLSIIYKTINWDNVYFNSLFHDGPRYEHEYVFGPLWWRIIRNSPWEIDPYLKGVILSNLLQLSTSFIVYKLTNLLFHRDLKKSLISSLIFLLNPIGIFGSLPYSENLTAFLILLAIYFRQISFIMQKSSIYIIGAIFGSLAFWTRSNSIVIGLIYLLDFLKFDKFLKTSFISGIILGLNIILYQYLPYKDFCLNDTRPWCNNFIPSLFTYVQIERWNNGFLNYWTPNNIPNFLIALPIIILLIKSSLHFIQNDQLKNLSYMTLLYVGLIVFFANIQIIIRISSFIPIVNWYLTDLIIEKRGFYWIFYLIIWIPLQTILFGAFLPPA